MKMTRVQFYIGLVTGMVAADVSAPNANAMLLSAAFVVIGVLISRGIDP